MIMSYKLMADENVQKEKLGDFAVRSSRSEWGNSIEPRLRELAPFPITYDVSSTQGEYFSEFTYTELLDGLLLQTQSVEMNCKIIAAAAADKSKHSVNLELLVRDKYKLDAVTQNSVYKKVCFLPGHNALDVASVENIARLAFEDKSVVFKPHPLTNLESLKFIAIKVGGWNRVLDKNLSGIELLKNADTVYTTTTSELTIAATIIGKKVINVSNFFNESVGVYYSISKLLYAAHIQGVSNAQSVLKNILTSKISGFVCAHIGDVDSRMQCYYDNALSMRASAEPLAYVSHTAHSKKL